jgi:hypothetical protein
VYCHAFMVQNFWTVLSLLRGLIHLVGAGRDREIPFTITDLVFVVQP